MSQTLNEEGRLSLPMGSIGTSASGWWGAWFIIISDATIFGYLFFAYFWYSVQPAANWVPGGPPSFLYSAPQTALVLVGCGSAWFAHRSINRNELLPTILGLTLTIVLGACFIALQALSWASKSFGLSSSTYGSIYFVITGTHLVHFVIGWIMFLMLLLWTLMGYFDRIRHVPIIVGKLYWYFLAVTWISVFFVINCTPYFF